MVKNPLPVKRCQKLGPRSAYSVVTIFQPWKPAVMSQFKLQKTRFQPAGDPAHGHCPVVEGLEAGTVSHQTLLGGNRLRQRPLPSPTLISRCSARRFVMAPEQGLLARAVYGEFREFFPEQLGRILRLPYYDLLPARRPMCLLQIPLSRRTHRSTTIIENRCAYRPTKALLERPDAINRC